MSPALPWPAPAKLNLFLHILGRRPDGYHELQTCFQFVDLCDEISLEVRADGRIRRVAAIADVAEEADLCVRAARALQSAAGCALGADISVLKRAEESLRKFNEELESRVEMRTADLRTANAELRRTLRAFYGRARAHDIERRLAPQCLSGFGEYADHGIRRAEVILTAEGGEFAFLDCAYEELLQALGPINDDRSIPWTMFNDDVQMGYFDIYDQYLLNILYDPRVRPGMTKQEVAALLPAILPEVRAWISRTNPLPSLDARNAGEHHGGVRSMSPGERSCRRP